jgi:hypothetical protein
VSKLTIITVGKNLTGKVDKHLITSQKFSIH